MNEELIKSLQIKAEQLKKQLDHLRIERASKRLNFHQWREFFTTKEKLHAIYLKLLNPADLVVYDIKVQGFKLSPSTKVKPLIAALDARRIKWDIDFDNRTVNFYWRRGAMNFPLRTYDVAVVKGTSSNAILEPSELKTQKAVLNSIKGEVDKGPIEGEFKTRSGRAKLVGGQIETEKWLKNLAHEHQVSAVLLESRNIENGLLVKHEIKPDNLKLSRVTSYDAPSASMFSSLRNMGRRIQRNLERARQRQARERARARKVIDPRGVSDKGKANKLAAEPSPAPGTGRRLAARAGKIAGRIIRKGVGLGLTVLEALFRAKFAVSHLRQDIIDRMNQANPEIEQLKQMQLESEENLRRFDAAPFDQFWFRIHVTLQLRPTSEGIDIVFRFVDIDVKHVQIVKSRDKDGLISKPKPTEINRIYELDYVEYQPVFEELTQVQQLAANGYPLNVIDRSHGGPKGKQRLQIIHDYIVFAKQYPELAGQYQDAWRRYKYELCVAGFQDLFTESEIEMCRDQKHAEDLRNARGTSWRPDLVDVSKQENPEESLKKYLQRIAPSQGE